MDFRFTDDQQDLIDAAKAVFDGENTVERMRKMAAGEAVSDLWPQLAELGLLGVMAPEHLGGLEQPLVVMAGIAETAGYAGLPEPLVEIAGITVPLAQSEDLSALISGELLQGIASPLRPYLDSRLGRGEAVQSIDPLRKLLRHDEKMQVGQMVDFHGAVLSAAELIGLSSRMVDMSVDYAKDREQFGKPIGAFQAIKHQLANVYTQIEFTRPMIHLAALKGGVAVHNAKIAAIDTATLAVETAIQVHGGMGYTFEVDLHLFMKRAWALCGVWGDRNYHMKKLEDAILGGRTALGPGQTLN